VTANSDLDEQQLFIDVPAVARILGRDERTVRKAVEAGTIPGQKFGARWSIPTAWVRQQAGITEVAPAAVTPDLDALASRVADQVIARLAGLFTQGSCGDGQDPEAA
jgi:hypothetical protein